MITDTPVKRYSSGMFVKLAFSVAAHLNSEILIMDEVLAVGDMAFQNKCLNKMREAADVEGKTVLYVSHNMQTIRNLCQRCIVMDQGKIFYDGDVESAIALYMNLGLGGSQVEIDLDKHAYGNRELYSNVRMNHLSLVDKVTPTYRRGEPLNLGISIKVDQPLEDIVFRIVYRSDTDLAIGSSWSQKMNIDKPGEYVLHISTPLDVFEKGTFYATIGLYKQDEIGRNKLLDQVDRAFKFEIQGNNIWNTNIRGYLHLGDLLASIEEIQQ